MTPVLKRAATPLGFWNHFLRSQGSRWRGNPGLSYATALRLSNRSTFSQLIGDFISVENFAQHLLHGPHVN
jgi:hypothetical protein